MLLNLGIFMHLHANVFIFQSYFLLTVKHAFEGELRIKNHGWDQRLKNKSSAIFKELSNDLEERLHDIVIPETSYLNNQAEFYVTILEFIPGSVIVRYR